MKLKKMPLGLSDFKTVIEEDYYYVDKSLLIKELIDSGTYVTLITRPRRFGKTLNLSTLKYFFEAPLSNKDTQDKNRKLFEHLKIWEEGEAYTQHCGRYPVIFLTFKDLKEQDWESCFEKIRSIIADEYKRHEYLLESPFISDGDKKLFRKIIKEEASQTKYKDALKNLTEYLHKHYGEKVIALLDEYDTPVHEAYAAGYYENIITFLRSFLGAGLKDNTHLEKGVMTGILRVARENIFSDLNNVVVYTIFQERYASKFGFTEEEVLQLLKVHQIEAQFENVKAWYNGYVFGEVHNLYNPWSILNFVAEEGKYLRPYWVNTSSNNLVNQLLSRGDEAVKEDLEDLIQNKPIIKEIQTHTIFADIEKSSQYLWSFLLFAGYLKVVDKIIPIIDDAGNSKTKYKLLIPNREVRSTYQNFLEGWMSNYLPATEISLLINSLLSGDTELFEEILQKFVIHSFSFFDVSGNEPERVYHAFVLGLLINLGGSHQVKSNRESGYGRYDIMLIPNDHKQAAVAVIMEFKKVRNLKGETLETACNAALKQIEDKKYESELLDLGFNTIYKYGIAFEGKKVLVKQKGN